VGARPPSGWRLHARLCMRDHAAGRCSPRVADSECSICDPGTAGPLILRALHGSTALNAELVFEVEAAAPSCNSPTTSCSSSATGRDAWRPRAGDALDRPLPQLVRTLATGNQPRGASGPGRGVLAAIPVVPLIARPIATAVATRARCGLVSGGQRLSRTWCGHLSSPSPRGLAAAIRRRRRISSRCLAPSPHEQRRTT